MAMHEEPQNAPALSQAANLPPWMNIVVKPEDEEIQQIDRLEQRASPLPPVAWTIRELITRLEICHFKIERHICRILEVIGSLRLEQDPKRIGRAHPKSGETAWLRDRTGRSRPAQEMIWALQRWLAAVPRVEANPHEIPPSLLEKVERALGESDPRKAILVAALLNRLLLKADRQPLPPALAGFWLQIEATDICHYAFPGNLERMIEAIGRLEPVRDFVGCGSYDQVRRSLAQEYVRALRGWLHGEPGHLAGELGDRTPAKEWLAACLAKTLKELAGLQEGYSLF